MSGITNYLGNLVLTNYLIPQGVWLGLHTADPGTQGSTGSEFIGGGYARQQITWSPASNRSTGNNNALQFLNLPGGTITYMGIWDASTGGNILYSIPLATALTVTTGQYFSVPVSDLAIVLN